MTRSPRDPAPTGDTGDTGRQRRIAALRGLAGVHVPDPLTAARQRQPRGHSWGRFAVTLLVAGIVLAGVLVIELPPEVPAARHPAVPAVVSVALGAGGAACIQALAWAPDGAHVAAWSPPCGPNPVALFGSIAVYDTFTGRATAQVSLDGAAATPIPGSERSSFTSWSLIWSPDGQQIALVYNAARYEPTATVNEAGLMLVRWATGTVRAYTAPGVNPLNAAPPPMPGDVTSLTAIPVLRWDVRTGAAQRANVPDALGYTWRDGALLPDPALPSPASTAPTNAPTGPIGNPVGGAHFTMWQSGQAGYVTTCTEAACCPVTGFYVATYGTPAAWSPDGRYLVAAPNQPLGATARIPFARAGLAELPGGCASAHLAQALASVPLHDAAEASAIKLLPRPTPTPDAILTQLPTLTLSWSPDGRRLAAWALPADEGTTAQTAQTPVVRLYDCATGQPAGAITADRFTQLVPLNERGDDQQVNVTSVLWSPDGQRLLALDSLNQMLLIFGPAALGA